jgi:phosphate starvation-inducible PhoH-like protein
VEFGKKDIVRHQLVQRIVEAYERFDEAQKAERSNQNESAPENQPE